MRHSRAGSGDAIANYGVTDFPLFILEEFLAMSLPNGL